VVDVVQEKVERRDPLDETLFDSLPFGTGDDARNQIKGEDPFGPLIIVIDGECHTAAHESQIDCCLLATMLRVIEGLEAFDYLCVVWSDVSGLPEHFIKKVVCFVVIEKHGMKGVMPYPGWGLVIG